jgi:hypothetical protein
VAWAIGLRPTLSRSSWRQYKAALRCALGLQQSPERKEALEQLNQADTGPCKRITRNTAAQKSRTLKPADFKAIQNYLLSKESKLAQATVVWLAAGTITGLRPCEWYGTRVKEHGDGKRILIVPNAKNTNGRANGDFRTLDLTALEPKPFALVKRHMAFVAEFPSADALRRAYHSCRKLLHKATRQLWPHREKYTTLYTARHQYCADAKRVLSRAEIASLMGHASSRTNAVHYARRISGQSGFRIRPNPTEVARVRQKAESRHQYIARKARESTHTPSSQPTR